MRGSRRRRASLDTARSAAPRRSGRRAAYATAAELQGRSRHDPPTRSAPTARRALAARPAARAAARGRRVRLPSRRRSTCARTPTCTSASWPSCSRRPARPPTTRRWTRPARVALLTAELATPRAAGLAATIAYGEETAGELAILRGRGRCPSPLRRARRCRTTSSPRPTASPTSSKSPLLLKEVGLLRPREGAARRRHRAAVRDHRRPAALRPRSWTRCSRCRPTARLLARARRRAGGHARLFRQQQGRRLPDLELGALQGRARAGRACSARTVGAAPVPRPRRHGRPRRRPELRGDPGAAARHRARRDPHHRAGRGDRQQVRQPGARPAQPGDAGRGDARGDAARRPSEPLPPRRTISRRWSSCRRDAFRAYRALVYETAGLRHATSANRRRIERDRRAQHRQPAGLAHEVDAASRTCARSPGCSAGRSAG